MKIMTEKFPNSSSNKCLVTGSSVAENQYKEL